MAYPRKIYHYLALISVLFIWVVFFEFTHAATAPLQYGLMEEIPGVTNPASVNACNYIGAMFAALIGVAGGLAVIMMILSGIQYIYGAGSVNQKQDAKERLFSASIGFLLAITSWMILYSINDNLIKGCYVAPNTPLAFLIPAPPAPAADLPPNIIIAAGTETVTLDIGDIIDFLDGVSAADNEDGPFAPGDIQVLNGSFTTALPGTYLVTYRVVDSAGNAASGQRVYIIQDPAAPAPIPLPLVPSPTPDPIVAGNVFGLDGPYSVVVNGNYAYVSNKDSGSFSVVDVSDKNNPAVVGTVAGIAGATGVALRGNYAYVAEPSAGTVQIVDVFDKANPIVAGNIAGMPGVHGLDISGNTLYAVSPSGDALYVIDISNATAPSIDGAISNSNLNGATDIVVSGNNAYIAASDSNSLVVIDVSDPSNPAELGAIAGIADAAGVSLRGSYAYITGYASDSLFVVDVSDSANPTIVGSVAGMDGAGDIDINGSFAYVAASGDDALYAIDVFDPANPTVADSVPLLDGVAGIDIKSGYAYAAVYGHDKLSIVNLYPPQSSSGSGADADIDTIPPTITLYGDNPVDMIIADMYSEPGFIARDDQDGIITDKLVSDAAISINTLALGSYPVTYAVSDAAGNTTSTTRTVNVVMPAIDTSTDVMYRRSCIGIPAVDVCTDADFDGDGWVTVADEVSAFAYASPMNQNENFEIEMDLGDPIVSCLVKINTVGFPNQSCATWWINKKPTCINAPSNFQTGCAQDAYPNYSLTAAEKAGYDLAFAESETFFDSGIYDLDEFYSNVMCDHEFWDDGWGDISHNWVCNNATMSIKDRIMFATFEQFDLNKDGFVDVTETGADFQTMHNCIENSAPAICTRADINRDGVVDNGDLGLNNLIVTGGYPAGLTVNGIERTTFYAPKYTDRRIVEHCASYNYNIRSCRFADVDGSGVVDNSDVNEFNIRSSNPTINLNGDNVINDYSDMASPPPDSANWVFTTGHGVAGQSCMAWQGVVASELRLVVYKPDGSVFSTTNNCQYENIDNGSFFTAQPSYTSPDSRPVAEYISPFSGYIYKTQKAD